MRFSLPYRLCAASLLTAAVSVSAYANPALAEYRKLFAKDERDVRHTKETDDDAKFAQKLLKEAESGKHNDGLTILLYEKAYFYALRDPAGYPTGNMALEALLEKDPTRKYEIGEDRMALWEKWHEAKPNKRTFDPEDYIDLAMGLSSDAVEEGDINLALKLLNRCNRFATRIDSPRKHDVRDTITELVRTRKAMEEIAKLEELLGTDPTAPDKLAMLYLADLDQPAKALVYVDDMSDAELAGKVRLTGKAFIEATPAQANDIGMFYFGLFSENKTQQPVAMLIRARVWLTEFLSREAGEEQAIQSAKDTLGLIDEALLKRGIGKKLRRKMSSLVRGEGQFDRPADIQAAIDKGVEWLYKQRNDKTHWEKDAEGHRHYGGYTALAVYALLMADEEPKINGDLSRSIHFMMNADMKGTYALCFRIHTWEVLPHRERYRQTLIKDVTKLRAAATRFGFWGYTLTGKDVKPGSRLDLSTTLAGGLGLWIGEAVGGISPKKTYWERTARALIELQHDDNGWSYNPATGEQGQGAMTAGGLALLYASYPHLSDATKAKADESIEKGLKWMDENFSATSNVNRGGFKNYYFAAVQHAGLFAGRREFREMDWYESIAEHLVKTQSPSGSMGDVAETAFAIAFLCRGGITNEYESENPDKTTGDDSASSAEAPAE